LNKIDNVKDYYVLKDEKTTKVLANTLVDYISSSYNFFKTGYQLFDQYVDGFESASVHVVSAPSNHGKSIFLINLLRSIVINNIKDFEENDAIVLLTLEDNIPKVIRRISSIFGNYKHNVIKGLYRESSQQIRQSQKLDIGIRQVQDNMLEIFTSVLDNSIKEVTQFKVSVVIKYSSENSFSPSDLSKFVDQIRVTDNLNTKMIVLD
jgi:replicative DNA helicase